MTMAIRNREVTLILALVLALAVGFVAGFGAQGGVNIAGVGTSPQVANLLDGKGNDILAIGSGSGAGQAELVAFDGVDGEAQDKDHSDWTL